MRRIAASLAATALLLTACGGSEPELLGGGTDQSASGEGTDTGTDQDVAAKPEFTIASGEAPPAELVIEDLVEGDGAVASAGDSVVMHYVGKAWSNGEQFDASWDRGQTFDFTLGAGMVIEGWDKGIEGMKVGGRRKLVIPADLAYGDNGAGGVIAPGETLVFVVDLVAVKKTVMLDPQPTADARPEFEVDTSASAPSELVIEDLVEGEGDYTVAAGDTVIMHYVGKALSTGETFDESWARGSTFDFTLGGGQVIAGWDQGIVGMKLGGRRMLTIPSDLAYGDRGAGGAIGPGETLIFVVDLVGYSSGQG